RLVTLAPIAQAPGAPFGSKLTLGPITSPGASIFPPLPISRVPGLTSPAPPPKEELVRNPGLASPNPQGMPGPTGPSSSNLANDTSTIISTSQPVKMANSAPSTGAPASTSGSVVNEQGTDERASAKQFQQNRRIQGSDQWVDSDYDVFRNYRSEWHDRDWWRIHQARVIYCIGGWYYWNGGYWFPAWGYDPEKD